MKKAVWFSLMWVVLVTTSSGQEPASVQWISFDHLDDSLAMHSKKVFVDFYTDWCTYCRKMDKAVFSKPEVIALLNRDYYAVKMDAETAQVIEFEGQKFTNDQIGKSRTPVHQIAQLLGLRNGKFAPPTMVILDEQFNVTGRYFEYLDSKKLLSILR